MIHTAMWLRLALKTICAQKGQLVDGGLSRANFFVGVMNVLLTTLPRDRPLPAGTLLTGHCTTHSPRHPTCMPTCHGHAGRRAKTEVTWLSS